MNPEEADFVDVFGADALRKRKRKRSRVVDDDLSDELALSADEYADMLARVESSLAAEEALGAPPEPGENREDGEDGPEDWRAQWKPEIAEDELAEAWSVAIDENDERRAQAAWEEWVRAGDGRGYQDDPQQLQRFAEEARATYAAAGFLEPPKDRSFVLAAYRGLIIPPGELCSTPGCSYKATRKRDGKCRNCVDKEKRRRMRGQA